MRKYLRIAPAILIILLWLSIFVLPVFAISNPADIDFGTGSTDMYNVFYNVLETGDWLVSAEGYVYYATEPTDYTAEQAFLFELLNTAGNVTLASTHLNAYGDRLVSMYFSAANVTSMGLTVVTITVLR